MALWVNELGSLLVEENHRWIVLARYMEKAFRHQTQAEEHQIKKLVEQLDAIYDDNEQHISVDLTLDCLQRTTHSSSYEIQMAVALVERIRSNKLLRIQSSAETIPGMTTVTTAGTTKLLSPHSAVLACNDATKAVGFILKSSNSIVGVSIMLILGPEGSGKTHALDQLEQ